MDSREKLEYKMDKAERLKLLAGYKAIYDNYLRRPMTAEEQQIYDDCAEGKITFEDFKEKLRQITFELYKNDPNRFSEDEEMDEVEMSLSEEEAKRLFGNKRLINKEIIV
ncbi:hypothetical protein SAMN02910357_00013 [Succinivibrio dextrinosolvens]|nr:hypothetical protein SAMN02910357_00013 [Succinivibrio dextrinosolvens]